MSGYKLGCSDDPAHKTSNPVVGAAAEMEEEEMTPYKLGWKVVRRYGRKLYSAYFDSDVHDSAVVYRLSRKTMPLDGCGPLCVFRDRRDAQIFMDTNGGFVRRLVIHPCAYIPSDEHEMWTRSERRSLYDLGCYSWSRTAALASEVILLKERKK